jgi:hypothetical protein
VILVDVFKIPSEIFVAIKSTQNNQARFEERSNSTSRLVASSVYWFGGIARFPGELREPLHVVSGTCLQKFQHFSLEFNFFVKICTNLAAI